MNHPTGVSIIEYNTRYAIATVQMWRDSKEKAIGVQETHSFEDHLFFLNEILAGENRIYLAIHEDKETVVGLIATDGRFINQLYIHNDYQRRGIGTKLIELAKSISLGTLQLYTFEVNLKAQAFYESHGFRAVSRGSDNEEQLPDILYQWNKNETHPV